MDEPHRLRVSPPLHSTRHAIRAILAVAVVGLLAGCSLSSSASAPEGPPLRTAPHRSSTTKPDGWLGINYNSSSGGTQLRAFASLGIVYDREGELETVAGRLATRGSALGRALSRSYAAGMVPDIVVDASTGTPGCSLNPNADKLCLPTRTTDVGGYVREFMATMRSVVSLFPGRQVLLEPMDEPWDFASPPGTEPGRRAATEYAAVLAGILRATTRSHLSTARIYVPATGELNDGSSWIPDLYAAQPCLKPGAGTCGPIAGWNVHPYGLPGRTTEGIGSVPPLRAQMLSGRDNVIVSEIGFCASNVDHGSECDENLTDIVAGSAQAARWLAETLSEAGLMHRAGWLKALIVWDRAQGGWAMQTSDGHLTAQGSVLERFARSRAGR